MTYTSRVKMGRQAITGFVAVVMAVLFFMETAMGAEDILPESAFGGDSGLSVLDDTGAETVECGTVVSTRHADGFDPRQFEWVNVEVDDKGSISLKPYALTGSSDRLVIPFEQEVYATFVAEETGDSPNLGWMLHDDAVDENGQFRGWDAIEERRKHLIFTHIVDQEGSRLSSSDGILDSGYGNGDFPVTNETALAGYDDGSGIPFVTDRDGEITPRDMKKRLGRFAAGSEIVFFMISDPSRGILQDRQVFFNKPWSLDIYEACQPDSGSSLWIDRNEGLFHKLFHLEEAQLDEACQAETNWLTKLVLDRLADDFHLEVTGEYRLPLTVADRFSHMIGGVSAETADRWVYGFENGSAIDASLDMDFNDLVFLLERPNGGSATLNPSHAIKPVEKNAYFTTVDIQACDFRPAGDCKGRTSLTYFLSVDLGVTWIEVNDWDSGCLSSLDSKGGLIRGSAFDPGKPVAEDVEFACRNKRIDLLNRGLTGNRLLWKVEMTSSQDRCTPQVQEVRIDAATALNRTVPMAAPVVQTNLVYSGFVETPEDGWDVQAVRGHLTAREIYDPDRPDRTNAEERILWDAGKELSGIDPDERTIFFPNIDARRVVNEHLTDESGQRLYGDGIRTSFRGKFAHNPIVGTSTRIYDGRPEVFTERITPVQGGSYGGKGIIDNATGRWMVDFKRPPAAGVPLMADYSWYRVKRAHKPFLPHEVTNEILALSDEFVWPDGFTHDFNEDGGFDSTDAAWLVQWIRGYGRPGSGLKKEWLMSGVSPSAPALLVPPGYPRWLTGTDITDEDRQGYTEFRELHKDRDSVLLAGSGGGLLHAFDAGKYRYGDNPATLSVRENRGYFVWEQKTSESPLYCEHYNGSMCPDYGTGREIWAFLPSALMPYLKNNALNGGNRFSAKISPVISDVHIDTDGDGHLDSWRSVVLAVVGYPGSSVFCLDVTEPRNPLFLWEKPLEGLDRDGLSPSVARIGRIRHPQNGEAIWAAFVATGRLAVKDRFPSIYVIDMSDGRVIQQIMLDAGADLDGNGILEAVENDIARGGILSGQPALVDTDNNGFIDRLYIGSSTGLIYKVNMPDSEPGSDLKVTHCVINTDFTDPEERLLPPESRWLPIYASPTVTVDTTTGTSGEIDASVRVFVGTGDSRNPDDGMEDTYERNLFLAYVDETAKDECDQGGHRLDWFVELPENQRITTSAFASAGRIYYGTATTDSTDICLTHTLPDDEQDDLYVFALDGTPIMSGRMGDILIDPLVTDEHLYLMMPSGLISMGSGAYNHRSRTVAEAVVNVQSWEELD